MNSRLARPRDRAGSGGGAGGPAGRTRDGACRASLRENAPLGIQVTKEAAAKYIEHGEAAAIAYIPTMRERVLNSDDAREGIRSFIERRAAVFQGR